MKQSKINKLALVFILTVLLSAFASVTIAWAAGGSIVTPDSAHLSVLVSPAKNVPNIAAQQTITFEINDIVGAMYDPNKKELIVIGQMLDEDLPIMNYDYIQAHLLAAMQAVHETAYPSDLGVDPLGPAVTIDPIPGDPNADHVVKFFGNITNTHYGYVFFESDRLLKTYTLGQDNLNPSLPFNSTVPNYSSFFDRWMALNDTDNPELSVRWWFTPSLNVRIDPNNAQTIIFSNTQVILNRELTGQNVTAKATQAANEFVTHFNANYDLFAAEQHTRGNDVLHELPQLYKLYGIAHWSWAQNNAALNISGANGGWLANYPLVDFSTPVTTPVISRTNPSTLITIYGGVGTNPPVSTQYDSFATKTGQDLLGERPSPYVFAWRNDLPGDIFPTDVSNSNGSGCCVAMAFPLSTNLIANHSFEGGPGSNPWIQSSIFELIDNSAEHWGNYGAYLGDYPNANDSIYQQVTIPISATNARLSFYWVMFSDELQSLTSFDGATTWPSLPYFSTIDPSDARLELPSSDQRDLASLVPSVVPGSDISAAAANDFLYAQILDTENNLLQNLQTISNQDTRNFWQISTYSLDAYKGQTIRVRFRATNNATNHTAFFIDDVSLDIDPQSIVVVEDNAVYLPIIIKSPITDLYVENNIGVTLNITIQGVGSHSIPPTGNPVYWGSFPSGTYNWTATASGFAPSSGTDTFLSGRVDWTFGVVSTAVNTDELSRINEQMITQEP